MGFGLIFGGLTTLLFFRLIPAEFIGFILVTRGLEKLRSYGKFFTYAKYLSAVLFVFSAVDAVLFVGKLSGYFGVGDIVMNIMEYVHTGLLLLFICILMVAFREIAESTGYEKGRRRAVYVIVLTGLYSLCVIAYELLGKMLYSAEIPIAVFKIVLFLYLLFTVYGFHMMIVTDSVLEKERSAIEAFDKRFGRKK